MSTVYIVVAFVNPSWGSRGPNNRDHYDGVMAFNTFRKAEDYILNLHSEVATVSRGVEKDSFKRVDCYEFEDHSTYSIHRREI